MQKIGVEKAITSINDHFDWQAILTVNELIGASMHNDIEGEL